jgi:hypothetical protein
VFLHCQLFWYSLMPQALPELQDLVMSQVLPGYQSFRLTVGSESTHC